MDGPPSFADLSKSANDIFNEGFGYGFVKLGVKSNLANGVEFNTSGSYENNANKCAGSLETKQKRSEYGLTFTERVNSDHTVGGGVTVQDQIIKGLMLSLNTTFSPKTGMKSGKVTMAYKHKYVNLGCDVDFPFATSSIHAVVGYKGWISGYRMRFDRLEMVQNTFAFGYKTGDFQLHSNINEGAVFESSIYQKVSDKLEMAVNLAWTTHSTNTCFGIAAKYQLNKEASFSVKVDSSCFVGIGYSQNLRPGVKLTLSSLVNGMNINSGDKKLGLGLEIEV
ncbi:voltage-dependent anion-selective channel protein 2-like isoform X1 [Solea solea]|uniref:voltage-dependent anion-selective channel protein 2-like isoform X1 n=1 Tax=Solea solea TaxID=90069 RepID=UPI00272C3B64|nr:voltage-dependent anion-selective channel protein 2-like isoform X1 [Solea solea]XP_058507671.1 voltage-dependent anion-selective channel protein 2-like isoform X1 [Solea solea]XP_058507672.1 voltage-dependent anion-selective channel protein 2-like isoform X1 [Solea solea]